MMFYFSIYASEKPFVSFLGCVNNNLSINSLNMHYITPSPIINCYQFYPR